MKLDLSRQGLQELPSDFFQQYKNLEELYPSSVTLRELE